MVLIDVLETLKLSLRKRHFSLNLSSVSAKLFFEAKEDFIMSTGRRSLALLSSLLNSTLQLLIYCEIFWKIVD